MRRLTFVVLTALIGLAACDGAAQPTTGGPTSPADAETVSIVDFGYEPATLTITLGQTVRWTNDGDLPHTVTFDGGPDSGTLNAGQAYEWTFDTLGEAPYTCTIHPTMRGVVNIGP